MNTNKLKLFTQETWLKLIIIIDTKLTYILSTDIEELRDNLKRVSSEKLFGDYFIGVIEVTSCDCFK
ncbi:MAG: hypothetical protein JXR64_07030 [Spirochaetales bacterium]|nr:hypothetical protein [Spirochaetales bacterium]